MVERAFDDWVANPATAAKLVDSYPIAVDRLVARRWAGAAVVAKAMRRMVVCNSDYSILELRHSCNYLENYHREVYRKTHPNYAAILSYYFPTRPVQTEWM